jgi:hypothetical protein
LYREWDGCWQLFKPGFGASLQLLKVEIGGDTQSTDGSESSHMHSRDDLNFTRGYEWWLMQEAKKRNPDIQIYGLSWGVPGWIGNGSFYSDDNIMYQINWVLGCESVYNIPVNYLGYVLHYLALALALALTWLSIRAASGTSIRTIQSISRTFELHWMPMGCKYVVFSFDEIHQQQQQQQQQLRYPSSLDRF